MKKYFTLLAISLALVGCRKKPEPFTVVEDIWGYHHYGVVLPNGKIGGRFFNYQEAADVAAAAKNSLTFPDGIDPRYCKEVDPRDVRIMALENRVGELERGSIRNQERMRMLESKRDDFFFTPSYPTNHITNSWFVNTNDIFIATNTLTIWITNSAILNSESYDAN